MRKKKSWDDFSASSEWRFFNSRDLSFVFTFGRVLFRVLNIIFRGIVGHYWPIISHNDSFKDYFGFAREKSSESNNRFIPTVISYNIISYHFHIISRVGIVIYRGFQISSIEKREIVVLANYYGFYKFFLSEWFKVILEEK